MTACSLEDVEEEEEEERELISIATSNILLLLLLFAAHGEVTSLDSVAQQQLQEVSSCGGFWIESPPDLYLYLWF